MPTYEFRCRACGETFEERRTMSESAGPARCPHGHDDTTRLLSTVAVTGVGSAGPSNRASARSSATGVGATGGGCCGGGCCG